ncbi:hypothetical protein CECT5772_10746 [Streptococcus equi subsp. ruminatorum CECT 5772]|uniref:Uncharacterized protein n=1 Tax=Streptococcus equi subsp. ruminatorum CECT 5772 TaxID=1051981 RepID=A0A922NSV8_9STRE|nr:hypothetical protein CECT5772_10746 [Streptococcus equi subsp. ruminatorum CECT 5772]
MTSATFNIAKAPFYLLSNVVSGLPLDLVKAILKVACIFFKLLSFNSCENALATGWLKIWP